MEREPEAVGNLEKNAPAPIIPKNKNEASKSIGAHGHRPKCGAIALAENMGVADTMAVGAVQ